jgi:predicted O-methyltransferase YrrM
MDWDKAWPEKGKHYPGELDFLRTVASRVGEGNYANIGTYRGKSTFAIALGLQDIGAKDSMIHAVDIFGHEPVMDRIIKHFEEKELVQYLHLCRGLSTDWARLLGFLEFRFVFIDADHHYDRVKEDFELWSSLIAQDGELAFHDVHRKDVNRVIEELVLEEWKEIKTIISDRGTKLVSFRRK